ncbi:MAG TPA: T9SS type A sorting domain-containing protein, partial [Bacteroidia bacterium]|nr:T9SS type A sorting domain-containing protein [Bacteroidia bacterium]
GRGAWYSGSIGPIPTSVQNISSPEPSGNLKVYPNPMSTEGNVEYTLTGEDNLTLTIYDIQGREVQNISLGKQASGQHILPINTQNFSNGTYLLNVSGTNFRKTVRIVIAK